jgi:hypothetical protein
VPRLGDTREAPCSWCGAIIVQTFARSDDVPSGFWDVSACACGEVRGLIAYGAEVIRQARKADRRARRYRNGELLDQNGAKSASPAAAARARS